MRLLVLLAPAACLIAIAGLLLCSPTQRIGRQTEPGKLTESELSDTLDRTGDLRNCPIHKQVLVLERKPGIPFAVYPLYFREYLEARSEVFRYTSNELNTFFSNRKWVLVRYCPECRRLKECGSPPLADSWRLPENLHRRKP